MNNKPSLHHSPSNRKTTSVTRRLLLPIFSLCAASTLAAQPITINNPYEGVSWNLEHRHKANLHTHTTNSDGHLKPHEVVDGYKNMGYTALAITDHDRVSYPWTEFTKMKPSNDKRVPAENKIGYEDRDPQKVGVTSIQGNEFSRHHHMVNLWTNTAHDKKDDISVAIKDSKEKDGQIIIAHPGRYRWFVKKNANLPNGWSPEKYIKLLKEHDHIIGLEVYNAGDKYPQDRKLWDLILQELMPNRLVWGFSNDDMHQREQMGRNQTILLVEKPTQELIKTALAKGQFFFAYLPKSDQGAPAPTIETISVDQAKSTITVKVNDAKKFEWISNGEVVGTEPTIDLTKVAKLGNYVRLVIYGSKDDTVIGTQPFGIVRK